MSHTYKVEVEIHPVFVRDEAAARAILESWGMNIEGEDGGDEYVRAYWGSRTMSATLPDEAHEDLVARVSQSPSFADLEVNVTTRWRCTDYDEWDDTFGEKEDG